jgi:hypothetical protein
VGRLGQLAAWQTDYGGTPREKKCNWKKEGTGKYFLLRLPGRKPLEKQDFERTKRDVWRTISALCRRARGWGELKMNRETKEKHGAERLRPASAEDGLRGKRASEATGRRRFLQASLLGGAVVAAGPVLQPVFGASPRNSAATVAEAADVPAFELDEITIGELQDGMKSGKYSARAIAEK